MTEIAGRTVLVTGAGSGLGRLMALRLARLGGRVVVWDLDETGAQRVAGEIETQTGSSASADRVDVRDRARIAEAADAVRARVGDVDILVNNAGIMHGGLLTETPDDVIQATFEVNALSLFWVTKAFLPAMIERGRGHVVTMASASGKTGVSRLSAYASSKHAAVGFDESLRAELRRIAPDVRTTVVCPYYVDTGLAEGVETRFRFLLPILEQDDVADRVVRAIQRNQAVLDIPLMVRLIPLMRLLPVPLLDRLADFLGVNTSMDGFVGRHGSPRDGSRVA